MPYIKADRRLALEHKALPQDAGELNYAITITMIHAEDAELSRRELHHLCRNYIQAKGLRYANINEVTGALFCAGFEFKRRTGRNWEQALCARVAQELYADVAVPYEREKITENGDIDYAPEPKSQAPAPRVHRLSAEFKSLD